MISKHARVAVVDDHAIVRQGLVHLLNSTDCFTVCGEAATPAQAQQIIERTSPDCVIVDLSLGDASGLDLIERIKGKWPRLGILVLSMYDESLYAERSLRAGARGYIMKREAGDTLVEALHQVLAGEIYVGEAMKSRILRRLAQNRNDSGSLSPIDTLTNRELEVFRLIGEGQRTVDIADKLSLSVKTVETYCARVKEKMNIPNARELAKQAVLWVQESKR
jgi:DNA-binding NarL/FixJ family response regulator